MNFIRRDDTDLGLKLVSSWPTGIEPTEDNVNIWLSQLSQQKPFGKRFRNYNSHFLLDWTENDIPDPQYTLRDLDLQLQAFPEVQSPYKFAESIFKRDRTPVPPSGFIPPSGSEFDYPEVFNQDRFIIKPPIFSEEDLSLLNPTIEIRKLMSEKKEGSISSLYDTTGQIPPEIEEYYPNSRIYGVRIYSDASPYGELPIKAVTHSSLHNMKSGDVLMVAPDFWLSSQDENKVFGPNQEDHLFSIGLGVEMYKYDDPHWSWYRWDDGDFWRLYFEKWFQKDRIPSRGEGYNLLLNNINGMSLGGNNDQIWIDPVYLANISKVNYHRLFREVSHCYKVDKCNYCGTNGKVFEINDTLGGFKKDKTAQLDDSGRYCRYRQSFPIAGKNSRLTKNNEWDYYCKYLGIPQRAVEYDGNYKVLLQEILINFRKNGILFWTQNSGPFEEEEISSNHYVLKTTEDLSSYDFGQLRYFNGATSSTPNIGGIIPSGTTVFHYTVKQPTADPEENPEQFLTELNNHKNSRIFALLFQFNDIDNIISGSYEKWLVELVNDYLSPTIRVSEFEVVEDFIEGSSPYIKDQRFRGLYNNGLRYYMRKDEETGLWKLRFPYELASDGFYNLNGGAVTVDSGFMPLGQDIDGIYIPDDNTSNPSETVVDIKGVVARGRLRAWGLPGEVITRNIVAWKKPTVIKWAHIQELKDRLDEFSDVSAGLTSGMKSFTTEEENPKTGLIRVETPNHILKGSIDGSGNRQIVGTGMVSNGDTPFSDIFLHSDILHTRNLCLPMLAYKLTSGLPFEVAEYFDESVQDIMSRFTEPRHLSIQRYGFREPGSYCFMRNFIGNLASSDEVSYNIMVPRWFGDDAEAGRRVNLESFGIEGLNGYFNGFSPPDSSGDSDSSTNVVYKIFHPNGMGWWRDAGILGAGLQWGNQSNGELGSKGKDFKQEGLCLVNFFRRNIPLDKELVACYLRLVPTTALDIGSRAVKTAGGGRQYTRSNKSFHNVSFDSEEFKAIQEDLRKMIWEGKVEDQERIIWQDEHQGSLAGFNYIEQNSFGEAYQASKTILGEYNITYTNIFVADNNIYKVTKPPGVANEAYFMWQRLDPEKTLNGHTLDDIRVVVSAPNAYGNNTTREFSTAQRSKEWYGAIFPQFMQGRHSYAQYGGLGTRLDYDEGGSVDSPNDGRGYGFACSSGGWAKDFRVFNITDIARLAYAQDRFSANYFNKVTQSLSDLPVVDLARIDNSGEITSLTVTDRVLEYSGDISTLSNLFKAIPSSEAAAKDVDGFINLTISLRQKLKPLQLTVEVDSDQIEALATEDKLRKNYVVKSFVIKIRGGQFFDGDVDSLDNPNYFIVFARSFNSVQKEETGWRFIFSKKWSAVDSNVENVFNFEYEENQIEQFREIRIITNADAIKQFTVNGVYIKDDPKIAPITSPPNSELHDINKSIQEHVANSFSGITKFTVLPIMHPATKVYRVTLIPDNKNIQNGLDFINNSSGKIDLDFDGEFKPYDEPKFVWEKVGDKWKIVSGTYQYSSEYNAIIIPSINKWARKEFFTTSGDSYFQYISEAKLKDLLVSLVYCSGRGASVDLYIEAENTGPAYDIDPEAISTITDNGLSKLRNPSEINEEFYGTTDKLIPYSVINKDELNGGYIRGVLPENGHAFFLNGPFTSPAGILNEAWKTKCRGILTLFGEPNIEINGDIEFCAPDFVTHIDPVTGEPLSNGFKFTSGLDNTKKPNGGRKPASLMINMQIGGNAFLNPSGNENDIEYRKKQVGFYPEIYVFLRERVDFLNLGDSTFGLNFEVK